MRWNLRTKDIPINSLSYITYLGPLSEVTLTLTRPISGVVVQWYSNRTSVVEVAGSIPAPVIVKLL